MVDFISKSQSWRHFSCLKTELRAHTLQTLLARQCHVISPGQWNVCRDRKKPLRKFSVSFSEDTMRSRRYRSQKQKFSSAWVHEWLYGVQTPFSLLALHPVEDFALTRGKKWTSIALNHWDFGVLLFLHHNQAYHNTKQSFKIFNSMQFLIQLNKSLLNAHFVQGLVFRL